MLCGGGIKSNRCSYLSNHHKVLCLCSRTERLGQGIPGVKPGTRRRGTGPWGSSRREVAPELPSLRWRRGDAEKAFICIGKDFTAPSHSDFGSLFLVSNTFCNLLRYIGQSYFPPSLQPMSSFYLGINYDAISYNSLVSINSFPFMILYS